MKTCNTCLHSLPATAFNKAKANTGGLMHLCKECELAYRRSYKGKLIKIYSSQRSNSKARKHPEPNYTFKEFQSWAEQHGYAQLHADWVAKEFDKRSSPSADRLNDYLPYTLDNLRLITWGENDDKAHTCFKNGDLFNKQTPVRQLTKTGEFVASFVSQLAAERATGVSQGNIGIVCRNTGRRKSAGGFKWEFIHD